MSINIYHGSTKIIENPTYGTGNPHNDYGLGFYCTENIELAKEWASRVTTGGFVNCYSLDDDNLSVFDLSDSRITILMWLALLINNRIFDISTPLAAEAKEYLLIYFLPNISNYDIIKGYRADDSYFTFALDFLSSAISLHQLSHAMELGNLGEQIVFTSKKAFGKIHFTESIPVDGKEYYAKRTAREREARNQYFKYERNRRRNSSDIFMLDILREEMKSNDARIQRNIYT